MRYLFATLALLLTLTIASASAAVQSFAGCTSDRQSATLAINLEDDVTPEIVADIKVAFAKTAAKFTAAELVTQVAFVTFLESLSDDDYDAIVEISGPPVISGSCANVGR